MRGRAKTRKQEKEIFFLNKRTENVAIATKIFFQYEDEFILVI